MSVSPDIINKSGIIHRASNFAKRMKPGKNTVVVKKDPSDGRYKLVFKKISVIKSLFQKLRTFKVEIYIKIKTFSTLIDHIF